MGVGAAPRPVIDVLTDFDSACGRWQELALRSRNIFSTHEWARTWCKHFGDGKRLALTQIRDPDGRTVALLPLHTERHGGVNVLRFLGHGVGDQLGPVCDPADLGVAIDALRVVTGEADLLLAERVPANLGLDGRLLYQEASPVIAVADEGDWDAYLRARSSNFRGQVRSRSRRVAREIGLRYRLSDDPARLGADLEALFALHDARWRQAAGAFAGQRGAFHREFAAVALERGWLRLWIAESRDRPVAAWYGFRFAGDEYYYQSGWDPALARFGVGVAILEHSIREAFAEGVNEYRLLRGDELYKRRYASSDGAVQTIAVPASLVSRGLVAVVAVLSRGRLGRRLLTRLAGEGG
jgi:CelD/BcsL family acetyltransferase involved in cellulose biosynthesis